MTRIILRDQYGHERASVLTHHDDPEFIRDLTADSFKSGSLANFGHAGDTLTVDGHPYDHPHHPYLKQLSSAAYQSEEEPEASTVAVYRVTSVKFEEILDETERLVGAEGLRSYLLSCLSLYEDGEDVAPGARYRTYEVTRAGRDLIVVKETVSMNI